MRLRSYIGSFDGRIYVSEHEHKPFGECKEQLPILFLINVLDIENLDMTMVKSLEATMATGRSVSETGTDLCDIPQGRSMQPGWK